MVGVRYTAFRERNGIPGYQPDVDPADVWVNNAAGSTGGHPTTEVQISNISNEGPGGGFADSWETEIELEDGSTSTFSGNF